MTNNSTFHFAKLTLAKLTFAVMIMASMSLVSCDNLFDNDDDAGEQELITKVTIKLEETGSTNVVTLVWSDPEGDGTGDFEGTANLKANTTYRGSIEVMNELAAADERDITAEILDEADNHQFFYTFSATVVPYATITITDRDGRNMPIGLEFDLVTTALPIGTFSINGTLNVVLSHYTSIVKTGLNVGNEEDINISAPISISL